MEKFHFIRESKIVWCMNQQKLSHKRNEISVTYRQSQRLKYKYLHCRFASQDVRCFWGSSLCSQYPTIDPYTESDKSTTYPCVFVYLFQIHFNIIIAFTPTAFVWSRHFIFYDIKMLFGFITSLIFRPPIWYLESVIMNRYTHNFLQCTLFWNTILFFHWCKRQGF